jgi:[acyl-carrier-protein] S-malonyltransferase
MEEAGGAPVPARATAGLSLGEYAALVAAGALSFRQAVRLVRRRGAAMQRACEANPGTMYAVIGLDDGAVEKACDAAREQTGKGVWPANYNCPGELVISGEVEAARAAAAGCSEMGARLAKQLDVAGAFHTVMMAPAAEELGPVLAEADLRAPACPVVANVTAQPTDDPEEIRDLLYRQVTSPVRWADSLGWFAAQGIEKCCEVGPGRVIRGHLRRAAPTIGCVNVGTAEDVRRYAGAGQ